MARESFHSKRKIESNKFTRVKIFVLSKVFMNNTICSTPNITLQPSLKSGPDQSRLHTSRILEVSRFSSWLNSAVDMADNCQVEKRSHPSPTSICEKTDYKETRKELGAGFFSDV